MRPISKKMRFVTARWSGFPNFTKAIRTITLRFILARETEKITRKLQDEIIPEMIKLGPKISQKINLKDINPELLGNEMNPEWQNMLSNSSLGKKMVHAIHDRAFRFWQSVEQESNGKGHARFHDSCGIHV